MKRRAAPANPGPHRNHPQRSKWGHWQNVQTFVGTVSGTRAFAVSEQPPPQKYGYPCLACNQRIPTFSKRIPIKGPDKRLLGFRHAGCSLAKT
jgi:hypothetical protein